LNSLPLELLLLILKELSFREILRCRELSCFFRGLIDSTPELLYKIELVLAGMEDGNSHLSVAEKRDLLRRHQHARNTLHPEYTSLIRRSYPGDITWDYYDGVIYVEEPNAIVFTQLPSPTRGIQERQWRFDRDESNAAHNVYYASLDVSQELLATYEEQPDSCFLHLLNLSTGTPHKQAAKKRIPLKVPPTDTFEISRLMPLTVINGRLVISLVSVFSAEAARYIAEFMVFDWQSGEILLSVTQDYVQSFTLLDDSHVLLACTTLESAWVTVLRIPHVGEKPNPQHEFALPALAEGATLDTAEVHSHPMPNQDFSPLRQCAFRTSRKERIIAIEISASNADIPPGDKTFRFLVHADQLVHLYNAQAKNAERTPWDAWGLVNTRLLKGPFQSLAESCVSGMAMVMAEGGSAIIFDFNPLAVRLLSQPMSPMIYKTQCMIESSTIEDPLLREPVTTSLPYVKHVTSLTVAEDKLISINEGYFIVLEYEMPQDTDEEMTFVCM